MADNSTKDVDFNQMLDGDKEENTEEKFDANDFFDSLDKQISPSVISEDVEPQAKAQDNTEKAEVSEKTDELSELRSEIETLKKRYGDSSSEAIRLKEREIELQKENEEARQLYEAVQEDERLVHMIENHWKRGGNETQSDEDILTYAKEELSLPEDFIYDADDAYTQPDSDSYKLNHLVTNMRLERKLKEVQVKQQTAQQEDDRKARIAAMKTEFEQQHGEKALEETIAFMQQKTFSLDDAYKLMTLKDRDKKIASSAAREQSGKIKANQNHANSLASKSASKEERSEDDVIWDALLSAGGNLDMSQHIK